MEILERRIDDSKVFVIDGLLDESQVLDLHKSILLADFTVMGASSVETYKNREIMFELDPKDFDKTTLGNAIQEVICKILKGNLPCYRVVGNYIRYGSQTFAHQDTSSDDSLTALYFANSEWSYDWGGELIVYNVDKESDICVGVKPGRLVLFPSNLLHKGGVPNRICTDIRLTISARYRVS
jgi:Rps23 Pro-64 3,4-dihydroxylase Tpa1-like proline 4-hydroxylase